MIGNLKQIEQSLSTRHIGIFPDYLEEINKLLAETPQNDSFQVIIFEDVLFYGAFYNGAAFKKMIQHLSELRLAKKKIFIAYYDNDKDNWRNSRMFREVVQESWMRQEDLHCLSKYRKEVMDSVPEDDTRRFRMADSIASEKYFALYRKTEQEKFSERREKILVPFYDADENDNILFKDLDAIKSKCFGKPENEITFHDIYTMYYDATERLKTFFKHQSIEMIPLTTYLSMSCWSNGEKVLFAFPGRFAADEIGFISHDGAILLYINTMLKGVQSSSSENNGD
jgi:hypothetical protein